VAETKVSAAEREPEAQPAPPEERGKRSLRELFRSAEVDTRLLGMLAALAIIWILFQIITPNHTFLTPRNMWNLSVQTAVVAIMATGMVLIIVTRNIDLSVGAVMAAVGMAMAIVQHDWLPEWIGLDHPLTWVITVAVGLVLGAAIGAFQGTIVAYVGVPSFIVTLGGFLVWRGVAWWMASGQTIAPMDTLFRKLGGGSTGTVGGTWSYLDITALGRQEEWEDSPEDYPQTPPYYWWSRHDEYDRPEAAAEMAEQISRATGDPASQ